MRSRGFSSASASWVRRWAPQPAPCRSAADGFNVDIAGYLFGNILAVTREELGFMAAIGGIVVLFILIFYKEMFALAFDEEHAFF